MEILGLENLWLCHDCEKTFVISEDAAFHVSETAHAIEEWDLYQDNCTSST